MNAGRGGGIYSCMKSPGVAAWPRWTFLCALAATACGGGAAGRRSSTPRAEDDPRRPLTAEECDAMIEHVIALEAADATSVDLVAEERENKPESMRRCLDEGEGRDFDCFMWATDLASLQRCNEEHEARREESGSQR
jgi:hypothetical protein